MFSSENWSRESPNIRSIACQWPAHAILLCPLNPEIEEEAWLVLAICPRNLKFYRQVVSWKCVVMSLPSMNDYCRESDITPELLLSGKTLPRPDYIKNGLVIELLAIKKTRIVPWTTFTEWMESLSGKPLSVAAVQKSVTSVQSKKSKLQKSKGRDNGAALSLFLEQQYNVPHCEHPTTVPSKASACPSQS